MTDLPTALVSALAERGDELEPLAHLDRSTRGVARGDLRIVEALPHRPADRQIVLVLRTDSSREFADVLLVHSAPELATDRDAIFAADIASTPYDVVVQTDLRAAVWTWQLGPRIGRLNEQSLDALNLLAQRVAALGPSSMAAAEDAGVYCGTRLAGPLDGRWSFKKSEGEALRRLAADCTEALLDSDLEWQVDPQLLRPDLMDLADDPVLLLSELSHWVGTRPSFLTDEDLEMLVGTGALDVDMWVEISDIGADLLMTLQELALRAATQVGERTENEQRCLVVAAHLDPPDRLQPIHRIHYLGVKEKVAA
ncbi:MAG: hypothetical protein OXL98_11840 [Acidimicrobiaceae bacterium]|nr:hypothetical protein [Acidimicrobiaceae bacterium]